MIISKNSFKKGLTNLLGSFGYIFCALQWLWAILLYYGLINSLFLLVKTKNINTNINNNSVASSEPNSVFLVVFSAIIIIFILALTVYVIYKVPSTIVKTGKKVVNETAESLAPLVFKVQHKKDTKKHHRKLTSRLILIIKLLIIIIPTIVSLLSWFQDKPMIDYNVVVFVSLWLAGLSIVAFGLQYLLAKLFLIDRRYLW